VATVDLLLVQVAVVFGLAKGLGELFHRFRQPRIVGEILGGVLVLNTPLWEWLQFNQNRDFVTVLAELGVVFLMFYVGLETPPRELFLVGRRATVVAVLGVMFPLAVGMAIGLGIGVPRATAIFIGVALVATSIGVTAALLREHKKLDTVEARVILGAAFIDDILGLVLLSVVGGLALSGGLSLVGVSIFVVGALVFVVAALVLLPRLVNYILSKREEKEPPEVAEAPSSPVRNLIFLAALLLLFGLSALASYIGLAVILGAFLAGMAFAEIRKAYDLTRRVDIVTQLLTPFFFASIGMALQASAVPAILPLLVLLVIAAVATKVIGCGLGAWPLGRRSALLIGFGMVPRGEVGIIVATIALSAGVFDAGLYAAIVIMAVVTTLLLPPLLPRLFAGGSQATDPATIG